VFFSPQSRLIQAMKQLLRLALLTEWSRLLLATAARIALPMD
jgi:hypothetical protein